MGIVKDSLPPVPEDKELRAKNRAQNEEQKKAKEAQKAKAVRKAQRREISAKNHREAEKAGVPPPDSPETSVSEIEHGGDNTHWLDELEAEEDDVNPLSAGGSRSRRGRRLEGGRRPQRGPKHRGAARPSPHHCRQRGWRPTRGLYPHGSPGGGEGAGGGSEASPRPVVSEGLTEPRTVFEAVAGGLAEAPWAEGTIEAPAPTIGGTGIHSTARGTPGGPQGAPSSQKKAAPEQGMYRFSDFSFDFLFFSFF